MSLKSVTRLDEGPLDFLRGAGREIGNKAGAAAGALGRGAAALGNNVRRQAGDVMQAGRAASAEGDRQALVQQLTKSVQQLGALLGQLSQASGQPADENPEGEQRNNPMPADNGQQPHQQQTDNVKLAPAGAVGSGAVKPMPRRLRPSDVAARRAARPASRRAVPTFDSFLYGSFNDDPLLNEGIWDFLQGAGREGANKVMDKWRQAGQNSTLAQMYRAGVKASREGDVRSIRKQIDGLIASIGEMQAKLGPVGPEVISKALSTLEPNMQRLVARRLRAATGQ